MKKLKHEMICERKAIYSAQKVEKTHGHYTIQMTYKMA